MTKPADTVEDLLPGEDEDLLQAFLLWEQMDPTLEDKILEVYDEPMLPPEEIGVLVEEALSEFPPGVFDDYIDEIYDIIYNAIEKALERNRR